MKRKQNSKPSSSRKRPRCRGSEVYSRAAEVLHKLLHAESAGGGIKTLVYGNSNFSTAGGKARDSVVELDIRRTYALVCETLKYRTVLDDVLSQAQLSVGAVKKSGGGVDEMHTKRKGSKKKKNRVADAKQTPSSFPGLSVSLAYVLLYDHLFGTGLQCTGKWKAAILAHKSALAAALARIKIRAKARKNTDLLPPDLRPEAEVAIPRYVRLNAIKAEGEAAPGRSDAGDSLVGTALNGAVRDAHIPGLVLLPPGTDLHKHPGVRGGSLILQDKASCMPAFVLATGGGHGVARLGAAGGGGGNDDCAGGVCVDWSRCIGGDAIDATAAPGNKTSHLAALLYQARQAGVTSRCAGRSETEKGAKSKRKDKANTWDGEDRVFAFDKSAPRLGVLTRRMRAAGADGIVSPALQDFLSVDPLDPRYRHVSMILLDPSCSGSGMTNRLDHFLDILRAKERCGFVEFPAAARSNLYSNSQISSTASSSSSLAAEQENEVFDAMAQEEDGLAARLVQLAKFQLACILHAFRFPAVQRVSYSTCSVYAEENEAVVEDALAAQRVFHLRPALPSWPTRGIPFTRNGKGEGQKGERAAEADSKMKIKRGLSPELASMLVRADPARDKTNGFFVAYFERAAAPSADNEEVIEVAARAAATAVLSVVDVDNGPGNNASSSPSSSPSHATTVALDAAAAQRRREKNRRKKKKIKMKKKRQREAAAAAAAATGK